jgi:aminoglycoside 6-adenylyltransferase
LYAFIHFVQAEVNLAAPLPSATVAAKGAPIMHTRSEPEMFALILGVAEADERVRAVLLQGSRANPAAIRDCFQDYDIVYVVTDVRPLVREQSWINGFGERMILQRPDDWSSHPYDLDRGAPFTWLMQFMDGTRIDLHVTTLDKLDFGGEPTVILLDKDGALPDVSAPSDAFYQVRAPAEKEFADCCNEFWWLCPYVAKELWRGALPMARQLLEENLRPELVQMLNWSIGAQHDFRVSTGKMSKLLPQLLSPEDRRAFEQTYPDLNEERIWASLFTMADLFRAKAQQVAACLGFEYPTQDDARVMAFLQHVRQLPRDAMVIYR